MEAKLQGHDHVGQFDHTTASYEHKNSEKRFTANIAGISRPP